MSGVTYREFAAHIGVPEHDVDAVCDLLPAIGEPPEPLTAEQVAELTNSHCVKGRYAASPLEEGTLLHRLENASSLGEVALILDRLHAMPKARWRDSHVSTSLLQALMRAAAKEGSLIERSVAD